MKIKKVTIHFSIEKKYELVIQEISQLKRGDRKKEAKGYQLLKRYDVAQIGNSKIGLPSWRREFFNKILCTKRRYIWCDTWCWCSNRSWLTKANDKRNTNKVQKHYSRKHHALQTFVRSLPQNLNLQKKLWWSNQWYSVKWILELIDMQS